MTRNADLARSLAASDAERLDHVAAVLREVEVSDRTAAIVSMLAMAIIETVSKSPDDAADFVALIARLMRR